MPLKQLFRSIEKTILAKYEQSSSIYHQGDKERWIRKFEQHL